ncbi:MAG: ParA family protein [Leptospiraceae bacterium]|nr:ParA family protein [Leptospiraceae bacterium]
MASVISVTNQKGGVAKTTTVVELAAAFARKDLKVLVIDLDSQRNATGVLLGSTNFEPEETILEAFQKKPLLSRQIHSAPKIANLSVIPSCLQLVEAESLLSGTLDGFFRLNESLENLKSEFDFIIIDCPPSLSMITINALVAANSIIVPLLISKFSIDGLSSILQSVETIQKRYNPHLKILGALLVQHDARTTLSQAMIPEIEKHISVFPVSIPRSVVVEEAHLLKSDLFSYSPDHKVTRAYSDFADQVIQRL